jgi:hypothetical protein
MSQGYVLIITELIHLLILEHHYIIHDDINRETETRHDIALQKKNGNCVGCLPCGDHFNPFGEVVCGHYIHLLCVEDGGCISLIKCIPHCINGASTKKGFKGRGCNFLFPSNIWNSWKLENSLYTYTKILV